MSHIFYRCFEVTNLNLSNFNTVNVTDMNSMFEGCNTLLNINLSSFKTEKCKDMAYMFDECGCKMINLSIFKMGKVINYKRMFDENVEKVKVNYDSAFKKISQIIPVEKIEYNS